MKKIKELLLPIYVILNILYILIGSYLFTKKITNIKTFSHGYIVLLVLNIIVIFILFFKRRKNKIKLQIHDLLLLLIIMFGLIATNFAVDPNISLFGEFGRYEGLFSISYYITLVFISSFIEKKHKKLIIYSILLSGLIQLFYASLQVSNIGKNISRMYRLKKIWATGFLTNPNFFGTYMLLCLSYTFGLYLDEKERIIKILNLFMIFAFTVGIFISNTMSCIVGLIIVLIYLTIYLIKNKKIKKLLIIISITFITSFSMHIFKITSIFNDTLKTGNEIKEIAKGNTNDKFGTNRMFIWKNTLKIVPKYILHGAGIDNFAHAFNGKALADSRWLYDKAHNEYLQILVCEGIFCLITYLLLYAIIVIRGIKVSFKENYIYLILPIIGYLAQAFFNISVIEVAPLFYIGLGLCIERKDAGGLHG